MSSGLDPSVLDFDRLPGSTSYMAPEEFVRGAVIDERTTVFGLGRMLQQLLSRQGRWRATGKQRSVVEVATDPEPKHHHETVAKLIDAWATAPAPR